MIARAASKPRQTLPEKTKYRELWYIQLVNEEAFPSLYFLKIRSAQQIRNEVGKISRFEWSASDFAVEWQSLVDNEHTRAFTEDPLQKLLAVREVLQPIGILCFPQWIMDRFKEALDQHVRGQWLSSISLCGDIVEFIVNEFWFAYSQKMPSDVRKTPSESTEKNLQALAQNGIIDANDHQRLLEVRKTRDTHVHYHLRNRLLSDYSRRLKADNVEVLRKLSEFFAVENMQSKYVHYLDFALEQFTTNP